MRGKMRMEIKNVLSLIKFACIVILLVGFIVITFLVGFFVIIFLTIKKIILFPIKKNARKNKDELDKIFNRLDGGLEELRKNIRESCNE